MTEVPKKKDGRGGHRSGSGRPAGRNKISRTFSLDADVLEILSTAKNRSAYINEAVRYFAKSKEK